MNPLQPKRIENRVCGGRLTAGGSNGLRAGGSALCGSRGSRTFGVCANYTAKTSSSEETRGPSFKAIA